MGLLGPHLREKCFSGGFSSTGCWTLSQAAILCNIKENQWCKFEKMDGENRRHYEPNLRKWQKKLFSGTILGPKFFFVNFSSTRCETLLQAIILCNLKENVWSKLKKMPKTLFWVWFRLPVFFFKNFTASITKYHGQLLSCTVSENTNDPILRKFSDGRTAVQIKWWADGHMDRRMRLIS